MSSFLLTKQNPTFLETINHLIWTVWNCQIISTLKLKFIGSKALVPWQYSRFHNIFLPKKSFSWVQTSRFSKKSIDLTISWVSFRSIFFSFGATVKIVSWYILMLTWSKEGPWNIFTNLKAMTITCFASLRGPCLILSTVMQKVGTIIFFDLPEEHRSKMKEQQYNCVGK